MPHFLLAHYHYQIIFQNDWFIALTRNRIHDMNWFGRCLWFWVPKAFDAAITRWGWDIWESKTIEKWEEEESSKKKEKTTKGEAKTF